MPTGLEAMTPMCTLRVYLDTSVVSHLHAPDVVDRMQDTLVFRGKIKLAEYSAVVSLITLGEIVGRLQNCAV